MENLLKKTIRRIKEKFIRNPISLEISGYPKDYEQDEIYLLESNKPFTMTSHERMICLLRAMDYICNNKIIGDFVECGVWRGGSMMLIAKKLLNYKQTESNLYLFDTFEGMSEPSISDIDMNKNTAIDLLRNEDKYYGRNNWCFAGLNDVKTNLFGTGYPQNKIHFIQGKVEDTLVESIKHIDKIALLRLDTDWYESTKLELIHLFDKVVDNGIIIIDDYGHWNGCKKAVDEFLKELKYPVFLHRIDYTGRLIVKRK